LDFFISEKCVKIIAHILIWHSIRYKININYFIFVFAKNKRRSEKTLGSVIDRMTNNTYKILKYMYSKQVEAPDGDKYIPVSQVEIADIFGMSTITVNKLFKQLKADDLLYPIENKRKRYKLSDRALIILKDISKLENKLEEDQ